MILQYEFGDPAETARENAVLAEHGFGTGGIIPEAIATVPEYADPIDSEGASRIVRGFSLTAISTEPIEQRVGISNIGERLTAGLESTYYDRISGTAQILPNGTIRQPFTRPL